MRYVVSAVDAAGVLREIAEIVSGGAKGVDTLAIEYARKHSIPCKIFPPDWKKYGSRAGPLRNAEMAVYADYGIAVWDGQSRGTAHMISLMAGRVYVWTPDERLVP
jgi:hypothetical protein